MVTSVEEFGIAAVEAQAAGRPVIGRAGGGLLETVIDGETGCSGTAGADELEAAVAGFDTSAVHPDACVENARRFDARVFRREFPREVEAALRQAPAERTDERTRLARRPVQTRRPGSLYYGRRGAGG